MSGVKDFPDADWWAHLRGPDLPKPVKRERGTCWVCTRDVAIRNDGKPQSHSHPLVPAGCPGSNMLARRNTT